MDSCRRKLSTRFSYSGIVPHWEHSQECRRIFRNFTFHFSSGSPSRAAWLSLTCFFFYLAAKECLRLIKLVFHYVLCCLALSIKRESRPPLSRFASSRICRTPRFIGCFFEERGDGEAELAAVQLMSAQAESERASYLSFLLLLRISFFMYQGFFLEHFSSSFSKIMCGIRASSSTSSLSGRSCRSLRGRSSLLVTIPCCISRTR